MKAATYLQVIGSRKQGISIHAAREGGDQYGNVTSTAIVISIHAAREGGDDVAHTRNAFRFRFQSTPPVKAATCLGVIIKASKGFQSTPPVKAATTMTKDQIMQIKI